MKTVAILSRKGGTGKTTLAVHLSVAAAAAGETPVLIDLDPQASAVKWSQTRGEDSPAVISAHSTLLPQILQTAEENGVTLAILDTAPHTEATALSAANAADLSLIPTKPAIFDLQAIGATVQLTRIANVPGVILFNAVPPRSLRLIQQARKAVEVYEGVPSAPCLIGNRIIFSHAVVDGRTAQEFDPNSKAAIEVSALYKYLCQQLSERSRGVA